MIGDGDDGEETLLTERDIAIGLPAGLGLYFWEEGWVIGVGRQWGGKTDWSGRGA